MNRRDWIEIGATVAFVLGYGLPASAFAPAGPIVPATRTPGAKALNKHAAPLSAPAVYQELNNRGRVASSIGCKHLEHA